MYERSLGVVGRIAEQEFAKQFVRITVPSLVEAGIRMTYFNGLDSSLSKLPPVLSPEDMLLFAACHVSYAEMVVVKGVVSRTRGMVSGLGKIYLPISASMEGGQHGPAIKLLYGVGGKPVMIRNGIIPVEFVTENDRIKRHMKPNYQKEREEMDRIMEEPYSSLFFFPEARLEGGRFDENGKVKGLQEVKNRPISLLLLKAHEVGRRVIVIPIGIVGTNRLLSAESDFLTPESIAALVGQLVGIRKFLAQVNVGNPFELKYEKGLRAETLVMSTIAQLIPEDRRGFYGKKKEKELVAV